MNHNTEIKAPEERYIGTNTPSLRGTKCHTEPVEVQSYFITFVTLSLSKCYFINFKNFLTFLLLFVFASSSYGQSIPDSLKNKELSALLILAKASKIAGKYSESIDNIRKAMVIYSTANRKEGIAYCHNELGSLYKELGKYNNSIDELTKAQTIYQELKDNKNTSLVWNNIGLTYYKMQNYQKAIEYFQKAFMQQEASGNQKEATILLNQIGAVYANWGNYQQALVQFEKAKKIAGKNNLTQLLSSINKSIQDVQANMANSETVKTIFDKEKNIKQEQYVSSLQTENLVVKNTNLKSMEEIEKLSFENQAKELKLHIIQDKYEKQVLENKIKEQNIKLVQVELSKKQDKLKTQRTIITIILIALVILIILLIFLFRLNLKLNASKTELIKLNASKDKFFTIISHDLKNPLSAFKSITKFLTSSFYQLNEQEKYSYIYDLNNASEQLNNLTQNLLQWAISQSRIAKQELKELDLGVLTYKAVALLSTKANEKGIGLVIEVAENTHVQADSNMLSGILINLISNAIKFTGQGGIVTISSQCANKFVTVAVKDTGIGISPDDIKKLFKIETDHKTIGDSVDKGTGLGLILCKEFVEKNSGKIWVESQLGKGSTFSFTIPKNKQ